MLGLRTVSRISPLLSNGFNRYASRPFEQPCAGGFCNELLTRRLLIGESLAAQAFDVYRNFFLYNAIAPYTTKAPLKYYDYYEDAKTPRQQRNQKGISWSGFIGGIWRCCWNFGVWFVNGVQSILSYICPGLGPERLILKLEQNDTDYEDEDGTASRIGSGSESGSFNRRTAATEDGTVFSVAATDTPRSWELFDDSRSRSESQILLSSF